MAKQAPPKSPPVLSGKPPALESAAITDARSIHLIKRIEGDEGTVVFSPPIEAEIEWDGEFYRASALDGDVRTLDKSADVALDELEVMLCMYYFDYRDLPDEKLAPLARRIRDRLVKASASASI